METCSHVLEVKNEHYHVVTTVAADIETVAQHQLENPVVVVQLRALPVSVL